MPEALGPPLCAEAVRAGSRSPSFNEQFRFTRVNRELLARVCLWLRVTDAWITKPFPSRSGESGAVPHMPDTHPAAARDMSESTDFSIAFYALSKLSLHDSFCLPHNLLEFTAFSVLLFGLNFHTSNAVFFSPLLFHYQKKIFWSLHCWCTSSLAPSCLQPSYPLSPLCSLNNLTDQTWDAGLNPGLCPLPGCTSRKHHSQCLQLPLLWHLSGRCFCSLCENGGSLLTRSKVQPPQPSTGLCVCRPLVGTCTQQQLLNVLRKLELPGSGRERRGIKPPKKRREEPGNNRGLELSSSTTSRR